jgi:hypothetical protein
MKTVAELESEIEKLRIEYNYMNDAWQTVVKDLKVTICQYQKALGLPDRTLRIV